MDTNIKILPSEEFQFIPLVNDTDPVVYFDRKISDKVLLDKYTQNSNDLTDEGKNQMNYTTGENIEADNTRITAKEEPLIKLNNVMLKGDDVDFFHLTSKGFYPELEIMVNDPTGKFFKNDRPGYNNKVTVVIIPKLDGKYKGIKLDFYVEDYTKISGGKFLCRCKYNYMPFEKRQTKIIKNIKAITPTPPGETWLGTFDMIKTIALENGFGFQATKDCRYIFDRRRHFMQRENYLEFIPRQFEFAGNDKNEIFDIFIDIFGYFTMINLPWVFKHIEGEQDENGNIGDPIYDFHHYSIWQESGTHREDTNTADKSFMMTYRIISNMYHQGGETNLSFNMDNFKVVINNYELTQDNQEGTLKTNYYEYPYAGLVDCDGPMSFDMKIVENSLEGRGSNSEKYEFTNQVFLGFEMQDKNDNEREDVPTLVQKQIVDKYKKKLHKEEIVIQLDKINFGLVRGIAVYVHVLEYDAQEKRKLLYNWNNLNDKNTIKDAGEFGIDNFDDMVNNTSFGVPRTSLCGFYYITAVDYFYERGSKDIKQTLTLVRHYKFNDNNNINLEKIYTRTVY